MKTLKIKVKGRVQGVFFRVNVKKIADEIGASGEVWNEEDGSVGILVSGKSGKLKEFIDKIKESPGMSRVSEVVVEEIKVRKYESFEIGRDGNIFSDQKKAIENLIRGRE